MLSEAKKTSTKAENIQQNLFLYCNDELQYQNIGIPAVIRDEYKYLDHWPVTTRSKSESIVLLSQTEALHR